MDYVDLIVTHPFLMLWLGQATHILKKVKETEVRDRNTTIRRYVKRHRYGVAFSVVAGLASYGILYQMNELSVVSAFMAGYMSDSIIDAASNRVINKVGGPSFYGSTFRSGNNDGEFYNHGVDEFNSEPYNDEGFDPYSYSRTTPWDAPDSVLEGEGGRGAEFDGRPDRTDNQGRRDWSQPYRKTGGPDSEGGGGSNITRGEN